MITHEEARKTLQSLSQTASNNCALETLHRYIDQQQATLRAQDLKTAEGYFRKQW